MGGVLLHQDGKPDGRDHKDHRAPYRHAGEDVGCRARSEGGLRALAAEGSSEIGAFALLKQNNADEHKAYDDVNYDEQINHGIAFLRDRVRASLKEVCGLFGAEGGT